MDTGIRDRFGRLWQEYCPGADLPITFEIGEGDGTAEKAKISGGWQYVQKLHGYLNTHDGGKNIGLYEH